MDDGLYSKLEDIVGRLLIQIETIKRTAGGDAAKQKKLRMKIEEIQSKLGNESPFFMASPPPKNSLGQGGKRRTHRQRRKPKH